MLEHGKHRYCLEFLAARDIVGKSTRDQLVARAAHMVCEAGLDAHGAAEVTRQTADEGAIAAANVEQPRARRYERLHPGDALITQPAIKWFEGRLAALAGSTEHATPWALGRSP